MHISHDMDCNTEFYIRDMPFGLRVRHGQGMPISHDMDCNTKCYICAHFRYAETTQEVPEAQKFGGMGKGVLKTTAKAMSWPRSSSRETSSSSSAVKVPEDVKKGEFAVVAVWNEKATRFVASLRCLSNPVFLRLLELAEEEFGFQQVGALAVPCKPSELERIIKEIKNY
ncbi:hypothetical protein ZIOFF_022757 [Zingiber officinale]|uniref:SAUR family protein n=2 Tax=Zingiber officinale TaxID=94328 RepID=A0A8J5H3F7_ZINOF|nr:hypothetical protein ZIOFF_022757 [Zingiber officinale]